MPKTLGLRLCLVVLICLSGCNAFTGNTTPETPSLTPVDIPTDDPNTTRGLAPGLTNQGVVDPIALGSAHEVVLANTSFTLHGKKTEKYTNGTIRTQWRTIARVVSPRSRYHSNIDWYDPNTIAFNHTIPNRSIWSNGERTLVATSLSSTNTTSYQHFESSNPPLPVPEYPHGEQYYNLFKIIDTKVVNHTTHDGTTLYRLTSTEIVDPAQLIKYSMNSKTARNPRNLTFHAVIDSRGVVHEYQLAYTATLTGTNQSTSVHVVNTKRYTNIGATTVDRPP